MAKGKRPCPFCGGAPEVGLPRIGEIALCCMTPTCEARRKWIPWHTWQVRPAEDAMSAQMSECHKQMDEMEDTIRSAIADRDRLRAHVATAEAHGRAAERAEIVADLKARADQRYRQAAECKSLNGDWQMVVAKGTEAEACLDIVRRRTKIEDTPEPSEETPA